MSRRGVLDMLGRVLDIPLQPHRVVSLCPSQTETLFELGLDGRVVGITRYCIHPGDRVRNVAKVGGTKKVDLELVRSLQPDLIIAEKEENPREMVEALSDLAPVFVTNVEDPTSAFRMIERLGDLTGCEARAGELVEEIQRAWGAIQKPERKLRVAYLIWRNPWMAAGPTTYIDSLIRHLGWQNVFGDSPESGSRYPEFLLEELHRAQPELVLLSSEPFPFRDRHLEEVRSAVPGARVLLTDGEPWSWYGARMREFPGLVRELKSSL